MSWDVMGHPGYHGTSLWVCTSTHTIPCLNLRIPLLGIPCLMSKLSFKLSPMFWDIQGYKYSGYPCALMSWDVMGHPQIPWDISGYPCGYALTHTLNCPHVLRCDGTSQDTPRYTLYPHILRDISGIHLCILSHVLGQTSLRV